MPKVSSYQEDESISDNDLVLGTDAEDNLKTKNYRIGAIKAHIFNSIPNGNVGPQGPQGPEGPQGADGGSTPKTSGSISLNGTFQVLPFDINSCSFSGGKAFLPTTTENGKEILVIAVANNIEIRANATGTNFMFQTFNTFISSVILTTFQMYRFTYIGFGGYWKAELI